jgi:hypothetical protein
MTGNEHVDVEDLAMFALFLVGEEETETVRTHIHTCAECREELTRVSRDLALYALATEPAPLPEGARERFVEQLNRSAGASHRIPDAGSGMKVVRSGSSASARTSPLAFTLGWAGWAVAAAVAVVALGLHRERDALRYSLVTQTQETAKLEKSALEFQRMFHGLSGASAVKVNLTVPKAQANPSARAIKAPGLCCCRPAIWSLCLQVKSMSCG